MLLIGATFALIIIHALSLGKTAIDHHRRIGALEQQVDMLIDTIEEYESA